MGMEDFIVMNKTVKIMCIWKVYLQMEY